MDGSLITYGQIKTDPKELQIRRLQKTHDKLTKLFKKHKPTHVVIENVLAAAFNLKSKDAVFWCVGTFILSALLCEEKEIQPVSYVPTSLKKTLTGNGRATKEEMIGAINKELGLGLQASDHNIADALALGLSFLKTLLHKKR